MKHRIALTGSEKEYLWRRKQQGVSHRQVAKELDCSFETVRKHWKAYRQGKPARRPGRPARGVLSQYPPEVCEQAIAIKRAHPHWGPANVRLDLREQRSQPAERLPSASRLSVLFRQACPEAVQPRKAKVEPVSPPLLLRVHQRWQVDVVEKVPFGEGHFAVILNIREPVGALMIASQAFETTRIAFRTWGKLPLDAYRQVLRSALSQWGCPEEVQTDHEGVFAGANQSDFPMLFTLWLLGLHIHHHFSRKARPTDQAQVERGHRTLGDLSWHDQHFDCLELLQAALDQSRQRYNTIFPAHAGHCQGEAPLQKAPWAAFSGRSYLAELEWEVFDLAAVDRYLAGFVWTRKVDQNGVLWLGGETYYFTRQYRGQFLEARFLPENRTFVFCSLPGTEIRQWPAKGLEKTDLTGMMEPLIPVPKFFQFALPFMGV